jgi:hypothetical protein
VPKKTTDEKIDELAMMIGRGFDELRREIKSEFSAVEARLGRIESHVAGQDRRITTLEDRVRQLATKIGLSFD